MRISTLILTLSLLFVACVSEGVPSQNHANQTDHNNATSVSVAEHMWLEDTQIAAPLSEAGTDEEMRLGPLDTANMEGIEVRDKLLKAVMKQITESKEDNEPCLAKLVQPQAVIHATSFYNMTIHNKSVTKVELDNSRAAAVKEEFSLANENLQMVKVHMLQLDGTPIDLNLIYVYSNDRGEWLLFRMD